ncbi:MAG: LysR family transcriptional regulator [Acidimicrobiales bacterium]|nr:LysR family transcriptional regulator [Acidimicrobiales bacterium]
MDLSIQQLRMLREVAELGTIAAAADGLGYTPSAVSQQLAAIEKSTGVAVLERVGRNVQLTDAGRELVLHADIVLAELERAQASLERVKGRAEGTVRLGLSESMASRFLPPLLRQAAAEHPNLEIRTEEFPSESSGVEAVRSGQLDACFVMAVSHSPVHDGIIFEPLFRDWFRIVVQTDSGWGRGRSEMSLNELADAPFVLAPRRVWCGRLIHNACQQAGFSPNVVHEIDDYPATLNVVAAGAGVSLVPELGLAQRPDGVRILDIAAPFCRTVELAYRQSAASRPATSALVDLAGEVARQLGLDVIEG